ncbi:hypothetical protein L7F22_028870 [Adiantum nelumboides]|nr:hypothetical protein [Adiantum nelumboides]
MTDARFAKKSMGRPKKDPRQKSIADAMGVKRKNVNLNEEATIVEVAKKKVRKFKPSWKAIHKWARPFFDATGRERVRCIWCAEFSMSNPYAKEGATTIQLPALDKHALSKVHKLATQRWNLKSHKDVLPIQKHVELMVDGEKQRIISVMQTMYFVAVNDLPLDFFESQCKFLRYMCTPGMPINDEYSAYTNRTSGMEFLKAAAEYYWGELKECICKSPFFSILIDDSTDLTYKKHLIVYMTYLEEEGSGPCACKFVALLPLEDGKAETKFNALMEWLVDMGVDLSKLIGFASDGASCMRGVNNGVLTKLQQKVPHIIGVHCVAHREALVVSDACDKFVEFTFVDAFANKVYAWVGRSTKRHQNLDKLMKAFNLKPLEVLRIHSVRWLSRGKVMRRLVEMMPALLSDFKTHDATLYTIATTFEVQFLIHLLADVLHEMNELSKKFQKDYVDITDVANALDVIVELFIQRYLGEPFGYGSKNYKEFMGKVNNNMQITYVRDDGCIEVHTLPFSLSPNSSSGSSLNNCVMLAKSFVQELINGINERFMDLPLFNAAKLFAPTSYEKDIRVRSQMHKGFLERLFAKFGVGEHKLLDTMQCEFEVDCFVSHYLRLIKATVFMMHGAIVAVKWSGLSLIQIL